MTLVSETSHKQNHCRNYKAALNEKLTDSAMILHSQFNLAIQFRRLARAILLFMGVIHSTEMDRFGPTGKVLKKMVHLLRWTTFPGRTGRNFG